MPPKSVFVSYSHRQGDWVWDRLVPALAAGGAKVLFDRGEFAAGRPLVGQMDQTQDAADLSVLVLSEDYLKSPHCRHELDRAIARNPTLEKGLVIPVLRRACKLPRKLAAAFWVDLTDDKDPAPWDLLMKGCGCDLGTDVPGWLKARDEVRRYLGRKQSVNLVVLGKKVAWRALIEQLARPIEPAKGVPGLAVVKLDDPATKTRAGLVAAIVRALGGSCPAPARGDELAELKRFLEARRVSRLALTEFDLVPRRSQYDANLSAALRYLVMDLRRLVLLIQSRGPLAQLLPDGHLLSELVVQTVELRARP